MMLAEFEQEKESIISWIDDITSGFMRPVRYEELLNIKRRLEALTPPTKVELPEPSDEDKRDKWRINPIFLRDIESRCDRMALECVEQVLLAYQEVINEETEK